jgi:hypothetical protein
LQLTFTPTPKQLPPPCTDRTVLLDIAFAYGRYFEDVTLPFLRRAHIARWVDHHPHEHWPQVAADPRFLLVDKRIAPACPELVTPEVVASCGEVARVIAHADFDGMVAAAKFLRGGTCH